MQWVLLAATVFAAMLLLAVGIQSLVVRDRGWKKMVDPGRFVGPRAAAPQPRPTDGADGAERGGWLGRIEAETRKAGMRVTAAQIVVATLMAGMVAAALAYTLVPRWYVAAGATPAGAMVPRYLIARAKRRRAEAFTRSLDGALAIMANSLRAGTSLAIAIARAAERADEPVRSELERATKAISLGATAAEALAAVAHRVESRDWQLVVTATAILTRTGGNLAEIYDQIAATIRSRRLAREVIMAHTAQIRTTANVVAVIPVAISLFLRVVNPKYFEPMLASSAGTAAFVAMFVMIAVGWSWIRSMANVSPD